VRHQNTVAERLINKLWQQHGHGIPCYGKRVFEKVVSIDKTKRRSIHCYWTNVEVCSLLYCHVSRRAKKFIQPPLPRSLRSDPDSQFSTSLADCGVRGNWDKAESTVTCRSSRSLRTANTKPDWRLVKGTTYYDSMASAESHIRTNIINAGEEQDNCYWHRHENDVSGARSRDSYSEANSAKGRNLLLIIRNSSGG